MAVSNTVIGRRIRQKTDNFVVETILAAKKQPKWRKVAQKISGARRKYLEIGSLDDLARIKEKIKIKKNNKNGKFEILTPLIKPIGMPIPAKLSISKKIFKPN